MADQREAMVEGEGEVPSMVGRLRAMWSPRGAVRGLLSRDGELEEGRKEEVAGEAGGEGVRSARPADPTEEEGALGAGLGEGTTRVSGVDGAVAAYAGVHGLRGTLLAEMERPRGQAGAGGHGRVLVLRGPPCMVAGLYPMGDAEGLPEAALLAIRGEVEEGLAEKVQPRQAYYRVAVVRTGWWGPEGGARGDPWVETLDLHRGVLLPVPLSAWGRG